MTLYLLHFSEPIGDPINKQFQAQHYLGWANGDFEKRIYQHLEGKGAKVVRAALKQNIDVQVVWVIEGDRAEERRRKKMGPKRQCPICNPKFKGHLKCSV